MVQRGLDFLRKGNDGRLGGRALVGLAFVKAGAKDGETRVREAIDAATRVSNGEQVGGENYTPGMATLFLSALDAEKYRPELEKLRDLFIARQKPNGGWGYQSSPAGDTSMTQYAALSLWELSEAGIETPVEVWEKLAGWLLRTQDPKGGWGYQGIDPGPDAKPVSQQANPGSELTMAAAGLGSLFICQDHLRLPGAAADVDQDLPTGFQRVAADAAGPGAPRTKAVSVERLHGAQSSGRNWIESHHKYDDVTYTHYYLYGLERYYSFREAGRERGQLAWYNEGVAYLQQSQQPDGSWKSHGDTGALCDTAFAILFLVRSTKKSLSKTGRFGSGLLAGGRGVPQQGGELEMRGGQVSVRALSGPAEEMLRILDDPTNPNYLGAASAIEQLTLPRDPTEKEKLQTKLRELAGGEEPEARLAAVTALGKVRELDNVPVLIYALSDPDTRVVVSARRGLEFISRKVRSFGPEDNASEAAIQAAIERWKAWFRALRPDAEFAE